MKKYRNVEIHLFNDVLLSYNLYLFIPIFISVFIHLFLYLFIHLFKHLFIYSCIYSCIHLFIHLYLSHFKSSIFNTLLWLTYDLQSLHTALYRDSMAALSHGAHAPLGVYACVIFYWWLL